MKLLNCGLALVLAAASTIARAQTGVFGGIELASSSIKGLTFSFQTVEDSGPKGGGKNVRLKRLQYAERNTPFISMKDGCKLSARGLDLLASQTKEVIQELRDAAEEKGLGKLQLFTVASSGLGALCNTEEIIERVQEATGLCLEFISASDEVRYSLGFVLPRDRYRSLIVDIGSGNTKAGYYVTTKGANWPPQEWRGLNLKYGARTLKDEALALSKSASIDYFKAVDIVLEEKVLPEIKLLKSENAYFGNAPQVYMVGGSIWATSTWARPVQQIEWAISSLKTTDYADLLAAIKDDSFRKFRPSAFNRNTKNKTREDAESELLDVLKRFDKESLYAGVSLALYLTKQMSPKNSTIYFPTTAAWISGYARQKFDEARKGVPICAAGTKRVP